MCLLKEMYVDNTNVRLANFNVRLQFFKLQKMNCRTGTTAILDCLLNLCYASYRRKSNDAEQRKCT